MSAPPARVRRVDPILLTPAPMTFRLVVFAALLFAACEAPVTSTFVDGTVAGVSIPGANAVSAIDTNIVGGVRRTVWLGTNLQCSDLGKPETPINFGPSAKVLPDGGRAKLLILVENSNAYLDTGVGAERLQGSTDRFFLESATNNTLTGRFVASFASLPDGGGAPDGGSFTGDFIAAPCASANPGCEVAPVGSLSVLGLVLLALRWKRRQPFSVSTSEELEARVSLSLSASGSRMRVPTSR